jgi:hypothetical protein
METKGKKHQYYGVYWGMIVEYNADVLGLICPTIL